MAAPRAILSWSSGKDSAFALHEARRLGLADIVGLLTVVNEVHERVAMHAVRDTLLERQAEAAGLPLIRVPIPSPCPNEVYAARMAAAMERVKADGIHHVVFGDLFLEDLRQYREEQLAGAEMAAIFPLWHRDTRDLAGEMIASGLVAHLTCIDPKQVPAALAGRRFDASLLADLPAGADPCGENGEFHTFVSAGPMCHAPIAVEIGETVVRDGFVFTDMAPL
ncbi:MAG: adenine nucleotide alpha hydrolase [Parvibaculum sp.]|nr:adenine nucleotide alpha hydrolase [Parvibaculum sp.]